VGTQDGETNLASFPSFLNVAYSFGRSRTWQYASTLYSDNGVLPATEMGRTCNEKEQRKRKVKPAGRKKKVITGAQ
jgi:hypothetical protein